MPRKKSIQKPTKKVKSTKNTKKSKVVQKEASLQSFIQVLADLRTTQQVETFSNDFFTDSEKQTFSKRLAICLALKEGDSYEVIRKNLGVSSATISSIAEQMSSKGFQLAMEKIEHDTWAENILSKLQKYIKI